MSSERRLPPSGRDFGVYTMAVVEQLPSRQVAVEFAISQTRVCQVVKRVADYLLQVAPPSTSEEDRGRQVYVTKQIAAEQVRFFTQQAYEHFHNSIGKQTVVRTVDTSSGRPAISTTKIHHGDLRFLDKAVKYALLGAKLPPANLAGLLPDEPEEVLEEADRVAAQERAEEEAADEAFDAMLRASREIETEEIVPGPPDEDCSRPATEPGIAAAEVNSAGDVNPYRESISKIAARVRAAFFNPENRAPRPVQLRELLPTMGIPAEHAEEFLESPTGEKMRREYAALVRLYFPGADESSVQEAAGGAMLSNQRLSPLFQSMTASATDGLGQQQSDALTSPREVSASP